MSGVVRRELPAGFLLKISNFLDYLESRQNDYDNLLFTNQIFVHQAKGLGVLSKDDALEYGVTAPNLPAYG
ncbi:MAG: hypothetical protein JKX98_08280 [Alcanivoracaceae bacterium]|nr:hypothetical protein [Alcanivoracaceae bacterium]MBL4773581.1 hypothetical protein [Alcanivoracaceae bacterium]